MPTQTLLQDNLEDGTLNGAITDIATTVTFAAAPGWASLNAGNAEAQERRIRIGEELLYITAYTAAAVTATVTRGEEGTTAAAHSDGDTWEEPPTADDMGETHPGVSWSSVQYDGSDWDTYDLVAFTLDSDGAQNNTAKYRVPLQKGTYDMALVHELGADAGIYTPTLAGLSLAADLSGSADTIDGYHVSSTVLQRDTITGIVIPAAGEWMFKLKMETKNASSSAYYGRFHSCDFGRTD